MFLVATANDISALPFELFRKGRFSEIFFIDLPNAAERKAAIAQYAKQSLHIKISSDDMNDLLQVSEGFSYSDIEYAIKDIAQLALINGQSVITKESLMETFKKIVPISKNNHDMVTRIRKWGSERAVAASSKSGGYKDE